jgi:amino acid permease
MARPTEKRMRKVISYALWATTALYWFISISAYLLFTSRTDVDALLNYGELDMGKKTAKGIEIVVKLSYALCLVGTFPLVQLALRQSLFDLRGWGPANAKPRLFSAVTAGLLLVEYGCAMAIPNIAVAFSVLGSTVAVWIGFVVPARLAINGAPDGRAWGNFLLVSGVILGVVSFAATLFNVAVKAPKPPPPMPPPPFSPPPFSPPPVPT